MIVSAPDEGVSNETPKLGTDTDSPPGSVKIPSRLGAAPPPKDGV